MSNFTSMGPELRSFQQLNDEGLTLAGVNNEIRALLLATCIYHGGTISVPDAHVFLQKHHYDEFHEMRPSHLVTQAERLPDGIIDLESLKEQKELILLKRGLQAGALGATLVQRVVLPENCCLSTLVGGYKKMRDTGIRRLPAPSIRMTLLEIGTNSGNMGFEQDPVVKQFEELGITRKSVIVQLDSLGLKGVLRRVDDTTPVRWVLPSKVRGTVDSYLEVVRAFFDSGGDSISDGYRVAEDLFDPKSSLHSKIPYLVKRSILGSGKSEHLVLLDLNQKLKTIFASPASRSGMTTTEIAILLGIETDLATTQLYRLVKNLNGTSCIALSEERASGNERIWIPRRITSDNV